MISILLGILVLTLYKKRNRTRENYIYVSNYYYILSSGKRNISSICPVLL